MKIYEVLVYDSEIEKEQTVNLAVLETRKEQDAYLDERYDELFQNSVFNDEDVFYYINIEQIAKPDGNPSPGTYDFFTVEEARRLE